MYAKFYKIPIYLIYFSRGICTSRDKSLGVAGAPPEEEHVYLSEGRTRLHDVDFETF